MTAQTTVYCGDAGCHYSDESEAEHLARHPWCVPDYVPAIGDVRRGSFAEFTWDGRRWLSESFPLPGLDA